MKVTHKLLEAIELIKEATKILQQAKNENESLRDYYGNKIDVIINVLNEYSDNSQMHITRGTCIRHILETQGENWEA